MVVMACGLFSKGGRLKISGIRPFPNNFHRNSPNVHVIYTFILKKHKTLISIGIWLLTSRFQSEEIKVFQQIIMKCQKLQIKLGQSQTTCKKMVTKLYKSDIQTTELSCIFFSRKNSSWLWKRISNS